MDTLGILEAHFRVLARLVDTLRFAVEDDLLELGGVNALTSLDADSTFICQLVLKHTLLARDLSSIVSVLLQLLDQPLDDFDECFAIAP